VAKRERLRGFDELYRLNRPAKCKEWLAQPPSGGSSHDCWVYPYVVTGALFFDDGKFVGFRLTLLSTADQDGNRSYTSGWRVDDFVLWDIKQDGSVPFSVGP
jgi:hypothetical protein